MTRSKPRKPRPQRESETAPRQATAGLGRRVLRALFRPRRLLLLALIPAAVVVAPVIQRHWPQIEANPVYRFPASEIRITPPPRPVPSNLVERAVGTAGLGRELVVTDRTLLPRLAEAFAQEPWVKGVVRLRKGLPAHVEVELEYRTPVAMIDVKQGVYPVDVEGVLLPPEDFSPVESRQYPLVTGVRTVPAGPPGTPWEDATVLGAAKIAAALGPHWEQLGVTSIQAPAMTASAPKLDDLTYELHTLSGSKIVWGRPPGTGHPGELTADQKINRLKRYVTDFGPLNEPGPIFEIDIRPWQEITRRPLSSADRAPRRRW